MFLSKTLRGTGLILLQLLPIKKDCLRVPSGRKITSGIPISIPIPGNIYELTNPPITAHLR